LPAASDSLPTSIRSLDFYIKGVTQRWRYEDESKTLKRDGIRLKNPSRFRFLSSRDLRANAFAFVARKKRSTFPNHALVAQVVRQGCETEFNTLSSASIGRPRVRDGIPEDMHAQIRGSASISALRVPNAIRPGTHGWLQKDDKSRPARATILVHIPRQHWQRP